MREDFICEANNLAEAFVLAIKQEAALIEQHSVNRFDTPDYNDESAISVVRCNNVVVDQTITGLQQLESAARVMVKFML